MEPFGKRQQRGFTLVELLIVMLVIAILASIAIPSYRQHVIKVKRADAMTAVNTVAQRLERCYTRFNSYADQAAAVPPAPECVFAAQTTPDGTYTVTVTRPVNANCAANQCYLVTAVPQGAQGTGDTQCGTMAMNQSGVQTASGSFNATPQKCW